MKLSKTELLKRYEEERRFATKELIETLTKHDELECSVHTRGTPSLGGAYYPYRWVDQIMTTTNYRPHPTVKDSFDFIRIQVPTEGKAGCKNMILSVLCLRFNPAPKADDVWKAEYKLDSKQFDSFEAFVLENFGEDMGKKVIKSLPAHTVTAFNTLFTRIHTLKG